MHSLRISISIFLALSLSACAWVKPTLSGAQVKIAMAGEVGHCRSVGTTTVSVMDNVVGVPRSYRTMTNELANLARNEAANLQGDTVVPVGDIVNGQQLFEVYDCHVEAGGAMTMPYSP